MECPSCTESFHTNLGTCARGGPGCPASPSPSFPVIGRLLSYGRVGKPPAFYFSLHLGLGVGGRGSIRDGQKTWPADPAASRRRGWLWQTLGVLRGRLFQARSRARGAQDLSSVGQGPPSAPSTVGGAGAGTVRESAEAGPRSRVCGGSVESANRRLGRTGLEEPGKGVGRGAGRPGPCGPDTGRCGSPLGGSVSPLLLRKAGEDGSGEGVATQAEGGGAQESFEQS